MLNFNATWYKPVELVDGSASQLIYAVKGIETVPKDPGAYVFCRAFGGKLQPLYVGETIDVRLRLIQHLEKNVRLMTGIRNSGNGRKLFLYCTIRTNSKVRRDKMLAIIQKGLIEHALSGGFDLLNIQLTKLPVHSVSFTGNRWSEKLAPRTLYTRGA